jgi:hypothetical protein
MSRIKLNKSSYRSSFSRITHNLVDELSHQLIDENKVDQPLIYEYELRGGLLRVIVVWDKWLSLPLEERTAIILAAYKSHGHENIALASGLTIPEAVALGLLQFRVIPALRKSDGISPENCWKTMKSLGSSLLFDENKPELYFATREEAEQMIVELVKLLPGSDEIWTIVQEAGGMVREDLLEPYFETAY